MRATLRASLLVALSAVAFTSSGPASAAVDDSLVLRPADVSGLTSAGTGSQIARAALGVAPPAALKRARTKGVAYRAGSRRLDVGAFALSSDRRARTAFTRLARGARSVPVGSGVVGAQRIRITTALTTAVVVVRVGRAIGAVRLRVPSRDPSAAISARAYARSLAARLRRVLAITAWQRALGGIRADGTYSPQTALQAFTVAYGPIPGARRPPGPAGVPASATLAMQMVARVWDRLTPAQQRAIDRRLGAPHDPSSPRVARATKAKPKAKLTPSPELQALAEKYNTIYHAKIPGLPPVTIKVFKTSEAIPAYADALPQNAAGDWGVGSPSYCRVRVPPAGQAKIGDPFLELVIAHETFHCIQFVLMANWRQRSAWLIEGMADWAAVTVDPVTEAVGAGNYRYYFVTWFAALFSRSYEASAFWGRIDEAFGVGSLWNKVPAILSAADDPASYVAAGGTAQSFVDAWASTMFRYPAAGAEWNQTHPFEIPSTTLEVGASTISSDTNLESPPYHTYLYRVVPQAKQPLIQVSRASGSLRVGTTKADFGFVGNWFCLGAVCKCPPKEVSTIPPNREVADAFLALGLSGGPESGFGRVNYHSLDEFCRPKPPTSKPSKPSGPAESNGDPHLTSLDGLHFDFQAAGEFILARSSTGDLEVQARQEGYAKSRTVTVNTQLALRLAGHRVTVSPGAATTDAPVVRIDGSVNPLPAGAGVTFGEASVVRSTEGEGVDVTWPDGSLVTVRPVGKWGVAARIALAEARRTRMSGLLGDFDGSPANDLANRRGKRIAYTAQASTGWAELKRFRVKEEYAPRFFDALYDDVGDAWRIRQSESLFDYGPGQSTRTFTDRSIPTKPVDSEALARAKRIAAEKICRAHGVTQPGPLADCITDVTATGNPAFADDARAAQDAALVSWNRLRTGADRRAPVSLLSARDGTLHLGMQERLAGTSSYRMVDVPIDAAGREGAPEVIDGVDGNLFLLEGPDGSARAQAAEIPSAAPSGVYQYSRASGGAWTALGTVTTEGTSYAGLPNAVFAADGTLITASPMTGRAKVFRGTGNPNPGIDPNPDRPDCYSSSPAVARDGATGAVWVAWVQWNCNQQGIYARQIDPATGAPVGPPIKAPGSTWTSGGSEHYADVSLGASLPFTGRPGRPGVHLAFAADDGARVRLWRVGDPASTAVNRRKFGTADVRLASDPRSGRLWLAWSESTRLWVQPTSAAGVPSGVPRPADPPRGSKPPGLPTWDIAARDGGADVLYGYIRDGDTPGGLWRARIVP